MSCKNPPNSFVLKMSSEFSLLVVSNRLPFTVRREADGGVRRVPAAGGLVTAVAPVVIKTKGNIFQGGPVGLNRSIPPLAVVAIDSY